MKYLFLILSALLPNLIWAEDIDLYIGSSNTRAAKNPQVLIVFDNSGSMSNDVSVKKRYQSTTNYPANSPFTKISESYIYYIKGDNGTKPVADDPNEKRKFLLSLNSCKTAIDNLANYGFYTGYVREYKFQGDSGSWQELPETDASSVKIVDCYDDIREANNTNIGTDADGNNVESGFPIDGIGTSSAPKYYTSDINSSNTEFGTAKAVTLYTDNYLRWDANGSLGSEDVSKMELAKEVFTALIDSSPSIDFGLEIFNRNYSNGTKNGGKIVEALPDVTQVPRVDNTADLKTTIASLTPDTNTPLCESIYEAYRYFSGSSVFYGDDDTISPNQDPNAHNSSIYKSPFDPNKTCNDEAFIILISDGNPYQDNEANTLVKNLTGETTAYEGSYLPALASWMNNNDINPNLDHEQILTLYTVGFALSATSKGGKILRESANRGGGKYIDAQDPSNVLSELVNITRQLASKEASFTAPSVTTNSANRTESLDVVYMTMFKPDQKPGWRGNLKKLKVTESGVVGRDDQIATGSNGNILDSAKTFWSTSTERDGNDVLKGGVVEVLSNMDPDNRNIYSDLGSSGLLAFTKANAISNTAFGSSLALATSMGLSDEVLLDEHLNWALGYDVDDIDDDTITDEMRVDVFGDPLHSQPVAVKYSDDSIGVFVGTNAGALHMFSDVGDTVSEQWAFMPKEFFKNIKVLKENNSASNKIYGIDATPTLLIHDPGGDGVDSSGTDKAWLFFGLRRGGKGYYALDVTVKNSPKLLWHIDDSMAGFKEIGQSWSPLKVTYSRINSTSSAPKPVLIFGGGYDTNKDNNSIGTDDSLGNGVYMVDAETGSLLWSSTSKTSPAFPGKDSIPSGIAVLDSDADGYTDRLYFGDTGGNLWRTDMFGDNKSDWQTIKLASVGSDFEASLDRRFFAEPSIARTIFSETFENETVENAVSVTTTHIANTPFDAILIGSGDRTRPAESSVTKDALFLIKDKHIRTQLFPSTDIPAVINHIDASTSDLYDLTNDPFYGLIKGTDDFNREAINLSLKDGWFFELNGDQEKSAAKPVAIAGVAYYNSFTPIDNTSTNSCIAGSGSSKLYALNLQYGTKIYNQRVMDIGETMVDEIAWGSFYKKAADPNNPEKTNQSNDKTIAILTPNPLEICDGDGRNCGNIKLKTMRSSLTISEQQ